MPGKLALLLVTALLTATQVSGADTPAAWLDIAANPQLPRREREFAAQQLIMLADSSASMFISELRPDNIESALRRQIAARMLGELNASGSEPPLLDASFSDDYFLARAASEALVNIYSRRSDDELFIMLRRGLPLAGAARRDGQAGDDWIALSLAEAANKEKFRALAMNALVRKFTGGHTPVPEKLYLPIWDGLLSGDRDLRLASVEAAALVQSDLATSKLSAFLYTENNPRLLIAALRAMAKFRPPDYGATVERHARHADPLVALEALTALAAMGYEGTLYPIDASVGYGRTVSGSINHPSTPVRLRAIEVLSEVRDPRSLEPLTLALKDRVPANRAAAVRGIGGLGFSAATGPLMPLLNDPHPEVRMEAALALDSLGVVGISARQLDDLESDDLLFKRSAAEALGKLGDIRAVDYLIAALATDDLELACLVAESLGNLADRRAGQCLYSLMTATESPMLADICRKALTNIYRDDPGYSPGMWESWARRQQLTFN
jgi:FOG: HEAT repeat